MRSAVAALAQVRLSHIAIADLADVPVNASKKQLAKLNKRVRFPSSAPLFQQVKTLSRRSNDDRGRSATVTRPWPIRGPFASDLPDIEIIHRLASILSPQACGRRSWDCQVTKPDGRDR